MRSLVYYAFVSAVGLLALPRSPSVFTGKATGRWSRLAPYVTIPVSTNARSVHYDKSLRFNVYTFTVGTADTGAVRELTVKAYRGAQLLTNFRVRVDGAVVGAEVADLDHNRFPEVYVYCTSDGSGSFGRVYAWQFLPERRADIVASNWPLPTDSGYMGHDSLWVERNMLCRKYPVYQSGDGNSEPTGGTRLVRYQLKPSGTKFALVAKLE